LARREKRLARLAEARAKIKFGPLPTPIRIG
jgi:hypothetical protein